jgi:flavin reductase (DIM6/NTAB) family NADH-FMN oxidoreductase RutF
MIFMDEHSRLEEAQFFPVPAALITFTGPGGEAQILPATWVSAICARPLVFSIAFQYDLEPALLPAAGAPFAINLPAEQWRFAPSFLRYLREEKLDLVAAYGLSLVVGGETGVPLVAECPIQVECSGGAVSSRFGRMFLGGVVVSVHTAEHLTSGYPFVRTWRRHLSRRGKRATGSFR